MSFSLRGTEAPPKNLGAWLHKVATNRALSRLRSDNRRRTRETKASATQEEPTAIEWNEIYRCVDEALEELPEKFRVPLMASFLESETKVAIARKLELSPSAVAYRIDKGISLLRKSLHRKGISVSGASLSALIAAHTAEAAPAALALTLGKLAMAGVGSAAPTASGAAATSTLLGGVLATKKAIIAVTTALVLGGIAFVQLDPFTSNDPDVEIARQEAAPPIEDPAPNTVEAPIAATTPEPQPEEPTDAPTTAGARANVRPGPGVVRGTVVDDSGQTVSGARVTLVTNPASRAEGNQPRWTLDTVTGEDGAFVLAGFELGSFSLFARHHDSVGR